MSANPKTADPTARKKISQGDEHAAATLDDESKNTLSPEGVKEGAWPVVLLGQIAEVKLGKMLDKAKHQTGRRLPYLRNTNVRWGAIETDDLLEMNFEEDQLDRFGLRPNDVLVCEGGEPGRASVWSGHLPNLKFQKALHRVRFKVPFDPRFLVYLLELLAKNGGLEWRFTGSTIKHFTREAFVQLPIPFPPESEQRRIVAEIEKQFTRLEAGVAALRRVQSNLKRYRAAILKAACEGRLVPNDAGLAKTGNRKANLETGEALLDRILTERRKNGQGRGKYKEPATPATGDLPPLPEDWAWATVEQLTSLVATGATPLRSKSDFWRGGYIPWVTSGALNNNFVTEASGFITPMAIQRTNAKLFPAGTLLVALYGEGKTRGKVSELQIEAATNQACAALLFDSTNSALRPYLKVFLHNNYEAVRLLDSGGVQPNLSLSIMKLTIVPLPPLAEQTRIVAEVERRLSVVEELEAVVSANLQRATRLRQCILQKAFTGKL